MSTLGDLVGDLVDLIPPLNVNPGTVLLTFRHGAPVSVIRPGRKLRRGRGLPLTQAPQGVPISTADTPIDVTVRNIVLPGAYNLPALEARVIIRIDEHDGYKGLISYVKSKGLNFAALLDGEIENALDDVLRSTFGAHEHLELYHMGNLSHLVDLSARLLDGLFRIESVQRVEPTWSAEFVKTQDAVEQKAREAAELLLEHQSNPLYRQVAEDQDRVLEDKAARRGLSLVELENPELIEAENQRKHELQLAIIQNADALRRVGNGEVITNAMRFARGAEPQALPTSEFSAATSAPSPREEPLARLKRDATLVRFWRRAGLPGEPAGMGIGDSTILAVCSATAGTTMQQSQIDELAKLVDVREVVTIDDAGNIEDVVRMYLLARVPELADDDIAMSITAAGERLIVNLASATKRLSPLLRRINDPVGDVLPPLEAVVPYDAIDFTVGGHE